MWINETCRKTNLTKKAVEYYVEQKLLSPSVMENGYRDFSERDIQDLKKISVLRKLGFSTEEIKGVLADETGDALQRLSVQKTLKLKREKSKLSVLEQLSCGKSYEDVKEELDALEKYATVTEKLLNAFPGYYGRFVSLHMASFLNEPITTQEQTAAYQEILQFLDEVPQMKFPKDVQKYLEESTGQITAQQISDIIESQKQMAENPDQFLSENREVLQFYHAYMQSEEYKNSLAYKMKSLLNEFNSTSGYKERFLPAMKRLSPSYAEYCRGMEKGNEKFLSQYPEWAEEL